jgi:hypothetical protein
MKTKLQSAGIISFILLLLGGWQVRAEITSYTAFKTAVYHQEDATPPVAVDPAGPYFFAVQYFASTTNDITNGVTFITPGSVVYSVAASNVDYVAYNSDFFDTKTGMDAAFPDGLYLFSINQDTGYSPLNLPTHEMYASSIPAFSGNTWTNLQSFDPGQPGTVNWNSFIPDPAATNAFVFVRILDATTFAYVFLDLFLPPGTSSDVIPAHTLDFNHDYRIEILFSDRADVLNAGFGGVAQATSGFENLTYTYFTTIPLILNAARAGTNVLLSWTNSASDYSLAYTHDLKSGNWQVITNQPAPMGGQLVFTNAIGNANTFFRLQK